MLLKNNLKENMIWHWMKKKSWKSFSWGKKSRGKVLVGVKKVGEKFWSGAKKSGGNLVGENVSHSSFFSVGLPEHSVPI